MAPNTRPPLTSRIRASLDGKRTKSSNVTSPVHTNGFITQDPDSLRTAIDEAINSDTFQKAIAANLAQLIKPSIKSALDTIQPVVEAVYSHQLLLRKTNQSVEDILLRLDERGITVSRRESLVEPLGPEPNEGVPTNPPDERDVKTPTQEARDPVAGPVSTVDISEHNQSLAENHAKTASALAELSSSVDASNGKIAETLQGISDVDVKLRSTSDSIETLKTASEQSHTTMAVLQAQIDQLKEDIGEIMTAVGTDLGKNVQALSGQSGAPDTSLFDAHTAKLETISADLAALKDHSETFEKIDAVVAELSSLKASVAGELTSNREGFAGLGTQISTVISSLEDHKGILGEIKDKGPHPDILSELQQSNNSHAAHATALEEIKERYVGVHDVASAEGGNLDTTAALQDLKSDLATLREHIEAGLSSNKENVIGVGAKVDNVLSTIEGHKASDSGADILAAVQQSNASHSSHAAILEELKSRESAPAALLDTSDLVARMDSISEIMNKHTITLDEIKDAGVSHTSALDAHGSTLEGLKSINAVPEAAAETESTNSTTLEAQLTSIMSVLDVHSETLSEIKTNTGDHKAALESHGTALDAIKSLNEDASSAPATDNSTLETQVAGLATILESHTSALEEIKANGNAHTTILQGHSSTLEGLRSLEGSSPPPTNVDLTGLEDHIAAIIATLETHTASLEELKTSSVAHATALEQTKSIDSGVTGQDVAAFESQINAIIATLSTLR